MKKTLLLIAMSFLAGCATNVPSISANSDLYSFAQDLLIQNRYHPSKSLSFNYDGSADTPKRRGMSVTQQSHMHPSEFVYQMVQACTALKGTAFHDEGEGIMKYVMVCQHPNETTTLLIASRSFPYKLGVEFGVNMITRMNSEIETDPGFEMLRDYK